jgi:hypothetical protein
MKYDGLAGLALEMTLPDQLLKLTTGGLVHEVGALRQAVLVEEWNGQAIASVREDILVADIDFHTDLCAGTNIC